MPKKNYKRKPTQAVPSSEPVKTIMSSQQLPVTRKIILYAIFLVFKLINYLTSFLPTTKQSAGDSTNSVNMTTSDGQIISVSLPKNFEDALENVDRLKEKLRYTKRQNVNLKYDLKRCKVEYAKLIKEFDAAHIQVCKMDMEAQKRQQKKESEVRASLCNAIHQIYIKIEHLRLKCQYGIEDLKKIKDAPNQSLHVKEISNYHIAALEQFINWMNLKLDYVKKFENLINEQPAHMSSCEILKHADLCEVISILHGTVMYFFKKYYVILMLTLADKEYIEHNIQRKPYEAPADTPNIKIQEEKKCAPAENPVIINDDDDYEEHHSNAVPSPPYDSVSGTNYAEEDWSYYEFTHSNGKYHNLYTFLLEYLNYTPEFLAKHMDEVKRNNNGTFNNMTVFDIARKVEKAAYEYGIYKK